MTSLKTSIKTITYLSDTGCLEIQGGSLLMKHDVMQGNNIVDLDLLRNFNGVPGLNRDNFIYISNIFSNIKQRNEKIMQ